MEKLVADLKEVFRFKDTTEVGDIVVIAGLEPKMLLYALVAGFERDPARRDEWWHVTLHVLSMPPQKVIWTLRSEQFTGMEIFTMDGKGRFMKAVSFDEGKMKTVPPGKSSSAGKTVLRRVK